MDHRSRHAAETIRGESAQTLAASEAATSTQARSDASATTVLPRSVDPRVPALLRGDGHDAMAEVLQRGVSAYRWKEQLLSAAAASMAEPRLS